MKLFALAAGLAALLFLSGNAFPSTGPVPGFVPSPYQDGGGTVWTGIIPGAYAPNQSGASFVYLPPHFSEASRYPVVYLLHGMPGSPLGYVHGLGLAQVADRLIASGTKSFIAVVPYGGPAAHRGLAEWAGRWESYIVHDVVPWADTTLPTIRSASGRVIGGLSAGGYGAFDIGLRHPQLFGTLESWSGYFAPLRDGPFVHASPSDLAAHDPSLLVRREAKRLKQVGARLEISSGVGHGRIKPAMTAAFGAELRSLGLSHVVWYVPDVIRGPDYADQMAYGLAYALARH